MEVAQTQIVASIAAPGKALLFARAPGATRKLIPTASISHSAFRCALPISMLAPGSFLFGGLSFLQVRLRLRSASQFLSRAACRCFNKQRLADASHRSFGC